MPSDAEVGDNRLRPLLGVYDMPPLGAPLRRLIEWTADYYLAPPASVLRMALASASALDAAPTIVEYRATGHVPGRMTAQREQGLVRELATIAGVSEGVIRGLVKSGAIEAVEVRVDDPYVAPDPDHGPPDLSPAQAAAAATLADAVKAHDFAPFLLDGVTGSGKTEVYFEAVAEAIRQDRRSCSSPKSR
jgi:primosomal protein N' (replication factor Y)